ncbi:MAG: hypothetical protein ABSA85_18135 [Terracidiphilus sp.]|jgi:hypothetical protein
MMKLSRFCRPLILALPLLTGLMPSALGNVQSCSNFTNLEQYIEADSTGGCQLGDKIVSDFAFLFTGGTSADGYTSPIVPPASAVTVTDTLADTSTEPAWVSLTFNFNGNASVTANQTMDLIIQYVVTAPPLATITEATMSGVAASRKQSTTATSSANLIGNICLGGAYDVSGTAPTGGCLGDGTTSPLNSTLKGTTASNSLSPNLVANQVTRSGSATGLSESQVGVYDEIKLFGGSTNTPANGSQAAASTLTQTFYESYAPGYGATPEPVPVLLVGFALVGLSLGRRQKHGS